MVSEATALPAEPPPQFNIVSFSFAYFIAKTLGARTLARMILLGNI